jgi:pSer/pThr/pTyr-binding forkhead associated (FHA) protein
MSDTRFFLKKVSSGSEMELTGDLAVGRAQDSGLRITEGNPSRHHARLSVGPEGAFVEDLKSTNGTYVNGTRIEQRTRLATKDKIRFDVEEYQLRVDVTAPPDADATKMRAPVVVEPAKAEPGWIRGSNESTNRTVFKTAEELKREHDRLAAARQPEQATGPVLVPTLRIYDSNTRPRVVELPATEGEWSIGSDEGREIRIQREGVSGLHAKIVNSGKVWKVVDQVAANGTFVNGERVTVRYLNSGDRINFGPVESVFEAPGLPTSSRAAPRPNSGGSSGSPDGSRRKRALLIAGAAFLGTLIVLLVLMKLLR